MSTVRDAELTLRRAQLASDVATLDRMLDDQLVFTGPDGLVYGKRDDLDAHRAGSIRIHKLEPSEERIRTSARSSGHVSAITPSEQTR